LRKGLIFLLIIAESSLYGRICNFDYIKWIHELEEMGYMLKRGDISEVDSLFARLLKSPFVMPWVYPVEKGKDVDSIANRNLIYLKRVSNLKKPKYLEGFLLLIMGRNFEAKRKLVGRDIFSELLKAILELRENNFKGAEEILLNLKNDMIEEDVLYLLGYTFRGEGKMELSRKIFGDLIERYPETVYRAPTLFFLGNLEKFKGNFDGALRYYNLSLECDSSLSKYVLVEIGDIFEKKGKKKEALRYYKELLKKHGDGELGRIFLRAGKIAKELGEDSAAINFLNNVREGSEWEEALYILAEIYLEKENYDEAEAKLLGLLGWSKNRELIYKAVCLLANTYIEKGDLEGALSYITGLLQDPNVSPDCLDEARYLYEWIRYLKGYYSSPMELNEAFSDLYPESPRAPKLLFEVFLYYVKKHMKLKAISLFNKLVERYPDDSITFMALQELHNFPLREEEVKIWEKYIGNKGMDSLGFKALYTIAQWAEERGEFELSLDLYDRVSSSDEYRRNALFKMGKILTRIKRENEALILFERLYEENPDDTLGFLSLLERISLLEIVGRAEEADSLFNSVRNKLKGDRLAEILYLRGNLAFKRGDLDKTLYYLKEALRVCESVEKRREIEEFLNSILERND
jgi:tetratricopeptide (TPR) repeat protein